MSRILETAKGTEFDIVTGSTFTQAAVQGA